MNHLTASGNSVKPDYQGGSIVNLMSSLALGLNGRPGPYPTLKLLPPEEITQAKQVVLLVIDGLGCHFFQRWATRLKPYLRGVITSVFPTSTAPAVTTFMTGVAPQQHAVTGWFMYLRELGTVATILPFRPRWGDVSFTTAGIEVKSLIGWPPFTTHLQANAYHIVPQTLVNSAYSKAYAGPATRVGYDNWSDCITTITHLVRQTHTQQRCYLYTYWPYLDALCHEQGVASRAARNHLSQLEHGIEELLKLLQGSQTLLIVTADHGFVDTVPPLKVSMNQHPTLTDCLAVPLCGEPRLAYCYLRPNQGDAFKQYIHGQLNHQFTLYPSAELLEAGWFGAGQPDPRLTDRIGDYVLIPQDRYTIKDTLPTEPPWQDIGVHGGVSKDEMLVPLITAYC